MLFRSICFPISLSVVHHCLLGCLGSSIWTSSQQRGTRECFELCVWSVLSQSAAAAAKSLQSCPTLCNPKDGSPPGSPVPGYTAAAAATKSLQSCPTLCNPMDGIPPGFPIPGILQARTLEWIAISFSNASLQSKGLSRVFSNTTVQKHQFFGAQPSSQSNSHIHT